MTRRWDGWSATAVSSGLACAVLYVGAALTVVGLPDTGAAGGEVARYVHDHRTLLLGGTYLWGLAITANIVFATAVWGVLGRADGPAAAANLAGLFGALALTVLEFGAFVVLATLAFRDALEAAMARTLADIFAITLDYTGFPSALWTGGASITMLAGRRYRPWLAWLGFASAGLHLVVAGAYASSGFFSPSGPLGLVEPVLITGWAGAFAVAIAADCDARLPRLLRVITLRSL